MCNLNIFVKSSDFESLDLVSFIDSATKNSFILNSDGDGVYFNKDNVNIKSSNRLNYLNFTKEIQRNSFILSHQRITTSGREERYTQPFDDKEFVFLHNGILRTFERDGHSDTFNLFNDFLLAFSKEKTKEREKRIIKVIKLLLDKATGSFSICLFDKKTQSLYYFKNSGCCISAYRSKDKKQLYISTISDNKKYLDLYSNDFNFVEFQDYKIYKITSNGKVKVEVVGELEKVVYAYSPNYWTTKKIEFPKETGGLEDNIHEYYGVTQFPNAPSQCQMCGEITYNWTEEGDCFCNKCLKEDFYADSARDYYITACDEREQINKFIEEDFI